MACVAEAAVASAPAGLYPSGREPRETSCIAAQLDGSIRPGDAAKLRSLLTANNPFLADLYLNSPGGDEAEAMRIGQLVRRLRLSVSAPFYRRQGGQAELVAIAGETIFELCSDAPAACGCAGACVLVWAAGGRRNGNVLDPHLSLPRAETESYLRQMDAPPAIAAGAAGWIAPDRVADAQYAPAIAAWLAATCGSFASEDRDRLLHDIAAEGSRPTTPAEHERIAHEEETISVVERCRNKMFANWRDSTSPE